MFEIRIIVEFKEADIEYTPTETVKIAKNL